MSHARMRWKRPRDGQLLQPSQSVRLPEGEQAEEQAKGWPGLGTVEVSASEEGVSKGFLFNSIIIIISKKDITEFNKLCILCGRTFIVLASLSLFLFFSSADVRFPVATDPVTRRANFYHTEGGWNISDNIINIM